MNIKKAGSNRKFKAKKSARKKLASRQFNKLKPTLSPEQIKNLEERNEENFCKIMQIMTNQKNQANDEYERLLSQVPIENRKNFLKKHRFELTPGPEYSTFSFVPINYKTNEHQKLFSLNDLIKEEKKPVQNKTHTINSQKSYNKLLLQEWNKLNHKNKQNLTKRILKSQLNNNQSIQNYSIDVKNGKYNIVKSPERELQNFKKKLGYDNEHNNYKITKKNIKKFKKKKQNLI